MSNGLAQAVTFDFGQTLADLDTEMLSRRLGERGLAILGDRLESAVPGAWRVYNESIKKGLGGHPWKLLMGRLIEEAGAEAHSIGGAVDWLWDEQPRQNLWRRPVPGMIDVVADLRRAGIPVGVISNSEGFLAELIDELGWTSHFLMVADSGKLNMEKPGGAIFEWAAERLGVPASGIIHIGDSHAADVEGALNAGYRAIWFRGAGDAQPADRAISCQDAPQVRAALRGWGLKFGSDAAV